MKRRKRTEITVETTLIIQRRGQPSPLLCRQCHAPLITPEDAAALIHCNTRIIFAQVEAGQVHGTETADGQVWICLNSLLA